jgi:hypothetical protein
VTQQDRIQGLCIFIKFVLLLVHNTAASGDDDTVRRSRWQLVVQPQANFTVLHRDLNVAREQERRFIVD